MSATATVAITTVQQFVEGEYFAHVGASLAKSTVAGYKKAWRAYSKHFDGQSLDLRTCDCQAIMRAIAAENPHLNSTSLCHIKAFFSGVWSHGLRMGSTGTNPWSAVKLPKAPEAGETVAYSPEEIMAMINTLATIPPYDLLVMFFAYTGVRKSEARGAQWRDFDATTSTLSVDRAVWGTEVKPTKNRSSKAPIPVVPALAARLVEFRGKKPASAFIFPNSEGGSLNLDNAARRFIIPALSKANIRWAGYHAFRRGLATLLHSQGIPDKEIQRILRHGDVGTTMRCYVKALPDSVRNAMANVNFEGNSTAPSVITGNATSETWTSPRGDDTLQK